MILSGVSVPPRLARWLLWVPAASLYGVITWLSHQPRLPGPGTVVGDFVWFKSAHFLVYGLLTLLVWIAWKAQENKRLSTSLATWYVLVLAASFDEFHQGFVIGRGSRVSDVLIDLLAAWTVLQVLSRYNHK